MQSKKRILVEDYFGALPMRTKCFIKGRKRGRGERERYRGKGWVSVSSRCRMRAEKK